MYQLHPKAKWLFFWRNSLKSAVLIVVVLTWIIPLFLEGSLGSLIVKIVLILILVICIFAVINYIIAILQYNNYKFELADDVYKAESGIIHKRYVSIPYERIQNVDIHRSFLARILGLSEIYIQTAGYGAAGARGRGSEGKLPGLSPEYAEKVRDALIQMAKGKREQGL